MITQEYKNNVYKFLERYLFIYNAAADGWIVIYHNKNNIELRNNINELVDKRLLDKDYFISYYKSKSYININ